MIFYHATPIENINSILEKGLIIGHNNNIRKFKHFSIYVCPRLKTCINHCEYLLESGYWSESISKQIAILKIDYNNKENICRRGWQTKISENISPENIKLLTII